MRSAGSGLLARFGSRIADACERWFPDALVFALAAILVVFIGRLAIVFRHPRSPWSSETASGRW